MLHVVQFFDKLVFYDGDFFINTPYMNFKETNLEFICQDIFNFKPISNRHFTTVSLNNNIEAKEQFSNLIFSCTLDSKRIDEARKFFTYFPEHIRNNFHNLSFVTKKFLKENNKIENLHLKNIDLLFSCLSEIECYLDKSFVPGPFRYAVSQLCIKTTTGGLKRRFSNNIIDLFNDQTFQITIKDINFIFDLIEKYFVDFKDIRKDSLNYILQNEIIK